ncbi:50S ribosomal protein L20 [Halanaerobaculum tunisiense]
MPRAKRGNRRKEKRKKILKLAKGYFGTKSKLYKPATEQVMKSLKYAYRGRKEKKRDFRKLWISRINAAARQHDLPYSRFIHGLKQADVEINRKMLADMAVNDEEGFAELVELAKENI